MTCQNTVAGLLVVPGSSTGVYVLVLLALLTGCKGLTGCRGASAEKPALRETAQARAAATAVPDGHGATTRGASLGASTDAVDPPIRAMWLWNETPASRALIENRAGEQDELLEFLPAPHGVAKQRLNRLFFAARALAGSDPFDRPFTTSFDPLLDETARPKLQQFLRRLTDAGVTTEFLAGQAIWLASDAFAQVPRQICRDVVEYNRHTPQPAARFGGIHLDIEPHTVTRGPYQRQWWQNRLPQGYNADWTRRWQQILTDCRSILDEYTAQTGHKMTLTSDVGSDFSHYNQPMYAFLNRADGPLDYISVLNYFDTRDNARGEPAFFFGEVTDGKSVGGVRENMENWTQLPVLFGLETGPESIAPDASSFHQEGWQAMYQVIDQLYEEHGGARLVGVGIHHYGPDAYREMKP